MKKLLLIAALSSLPACGPDLASTTQNVAAGAVVCLSDGGACWRVPTPPPGKLGNCSIFPDGGTDCPDAGAP